MISRVLASTSLSTWCPYLTVSSFAKVANFFAGRAPLAVSQMANRLSCDRSSFYNHGLASSQDSTKSSRVGCGSLEPATGTEATAWTDDFKRSMSVIGRRTAIVPATALSTPTSTRPGVTGDSGPPIHDVKPAGRQFILAITRCAPRSATEQTVLSHSWAKGHLLGRPCLALHCIPH